MASSFGPSYDAVTLRGYAALQRRLAAVGGVARGSSRLLPQLALQANREQRKLLYSQVTRRTGFAGRTIGLGAVTPTSAATVARSYAVYIDRGTRPHVITPRNRSVLAWAGDPSGRRATGATRKGYAGPMVFARTVHHPGTKPRPFMLPGARLAVAGAGLARQVVAAWDGAA